MIRRLIFLVLLAAVGVGCVTNKKYTYLQKDDLHVKQKLDTPLRSYNLPLFAYRIQPEDILSVEFTSLTAKEYDILSRQSSFQSGTVNLTQGSGLVLGDLVDPQGFIFFPVIGRVEVRDLTVYEIQIKFQELANQYLESPVVKVRLINFRVTLLGEVVREGTIPIQNANRVSVIEAIGLAGGLKDLADKSSVKLIRQRNGKTEVSYINLLDENFLNSPGYYLHQNDILIVPPLKQRPYRAYFGQNFALVVSALTLLLLAANLLKN